MVSALDNQTIEIEGFPDLIEVTPCSDPKYSLFFMSGLGLLKNLIRLQHPEFSDFLANFEEKLSKTRNFATNYGLSAYYDIFERTYKFLKENSNRTEAISWLISYSLTYPNISQSIYYGMKSIACSVLSEKGHDIHNILNDADDSENSKILETFAESFKVYINLVWSAGNYIYKKPENSKGPIINLYFIANGSYALLNDRRELNYDQSFDMSPDEILYHPFVEENNAKKEFSDDQICDPLISNLLSIMALKIVEKKLFSGEILEAYHNAKQKFPGLTMIPGLQSIENIQNSCRIHENSEFLKGFCKTMHCKFCIYEIIRTKFSSKNILIYCPCQKQIPPKEIDQLRKTSQYLEYKNSFKQ